MMFPSLVWLPGSSQKHISCFACSRDDLLSVGSLLLYMSLGVALVIHLFWLRWAPGKRRLRVEGSVVSRVDCSGCLHGRAQRTWAQHLGGPGSSGAAALRSPLPCALPAVLSVARCGLPGEQRPLPKRQRLSKQLRPWRRVCDLPPFALPGMVMGVGSSSGLLLHVFFPLVAWHQVGCQGG